MKNRRAEIRHCDFFISTFWAATAAEWDGTYTYSWVVSEY